MPPETTVIRCLDSVRAQAENAVSAQAERAFDSVYKGMARAIRQAAVYTTPRQLDYIYSFATHEKRKAFGQKLRSGSHALFLGDGKPEPYQLFVVPGEDGETWVFLASKEGDNGSLVVFQAMSGGSPRPTNPVIKFSFSREGVTAENSALCQAPSLPRDSIAELGGFYWSVPVYFNEMLSTPTYGDGVKHVTILDPRLFVP
ncbi:hypothetical protein [Hyphomicrobium sp. DMF-1]|jgi:hypothetical protein|uniref:hypothetical protein n=1 Tax=Hyphomicrobium sp. DMF-1 TaxID=3019544 RepID=UPI0022EBFCCE|nr:hypothetical protein [Hyphomicrobium sp. DMF-1]WBT38975.1 hypothetical protein PE058_03620 [Hyphomicrobium sp. DMF-1]